MISIHNPEEYRELLSDHPAVLCYFSTPDCTVCRVLKPKVMDMVSARFPEMSTAWIDMERSPLVSGQLRIFSAPTILVYFEGKENLRKSRNISLSELEREIGRIYALLFKK